MNAPRTLRKRFDSPEDGGGGDGVDTDTRDHEGSDRVRPIRCPKCGWRPPWHALWSCFCGHAWNTFDTEGRCPECGERWDHTQCLRCHEWSPHQAWCGEERP